MTGTLDDPHRDDAPGAAAAPPNRFGPGTRLGRYLVLERLGEGGMGVVWAAWDERLERRVALKLLRAQHELAGDGERLLREARTVAQLNHPHVVAVHDAGVAAGEVFIALELVAGTTLRTWLQTPRTPADILGMFLQAGRGLAGAHEKGLVHRDFKPENVLVGTDGRARVTDFGLARPPAAASDPVLPREELIGTSTMRGTPAYMSPEQISFGRADARADQFAYCVALFEALYGEHPFAPRAGGGTDALLRAIITGAVKTPAQPGRAPPTVHAALLRGLAVDADARWPSMNALLAALPDALEAPRRRKRRMAIAAVAGAVLAFTALEADRRAHRCDPPPGPLAPTGVAVFDARARMWWDAAKDACEATRVRGEQSEAALSLRSTCLDRRRDELAALAPLLPAAAEAVGDVAPCADLDALTHLVPAPADPRVARLSKALAGTLALAAAGHPPAGLDGLAAEARALGWAPLEADALAQLSAATADATAAHALAVDALLAAERGRDFNRTVEARIALVRLARGLGREDEAKGHVRHAEALLATRPNASRAARLAAAVQR